MTCCSVKAARTMHMVLFEQRLSRTDLHEMIRSVIGADEAFEAFRGCRKHRAKNTFAMFCVFYRNPAFEQHRNMELPPDWATLCFFRMPDSMACCRRGIMHWSLYENKTSLVSSSF